MDLNSLSNDELIALAGPPKQELNSLSNEDLIAIAGAPQKEEPTTGESLSSGFLAGTAGLGDLVNLASQGVAYVNPLNIASRIVTGKPITTGEVPLGDLARAGFDKATGLQDSTKIGEDTLSYKVASYLPGILAGGNPFSGAIKSGAGAAGKTITNSAANLAKALGFTGITGTAGYVGNEIAGAPGEIVASILAGQGATTASRSAKELASLPSKLGTVAKEEAAQLAAKKIISDVADVEAAKKTLQAARIADEAAPYITKQSETYLPQYVRTAEITQQPGIAALEKAIQTTAPEAKQAIPLQDASREAARQKIFNNLIPEQLTPEDAAQRIRQGLQENADVMSEAVKKYADKAFKGGEELKTFGAKVAVSNAVKEFTKDGSRSVSPQLMELIDNFRALPAKTDLKTLQNYRSAFGEWSGAGRALGASTVDKQSAKIASSLRSAIDDTIEKAIETGQLPKGQADAWKKMVEARAVKGDLFESGAVGDILEKSPFSSARNVKYELPIEKVVKKPFNTVEDAKQLIGGLKGKSKSITASRTALLNKLWDNVVSPTNGEIKPTTFINRVSALKNSGVAGEILTPSQIKALDKISTDLSSQASVARRATAASRSQSMTTETRSMIDIVQDAVKESSVSGFRQSLGKMRFLGPALEMVFNNISNPAQRQMLINKELTKFILDPKYAEMLLSKNISVKKRAFEGFGKQLQQSFMESGLASSVSSYSNEH